MPHNTATAAFRIRKALRPCRGYLLFFAVMFLFFLGARQLEKTGMAYVLTCLQNTPRIRAEGAEPRALPPGFQFSAVTLDAMPGRQGGMREAMPDLRLENVSLNFGIGGFFPPQGRFSLSADLAGGKLHGTMIPDSLTNPAGGMLTFTLHEASLAELAGNYSLIVIEKGTVSIKGECLLRGDISKAEGRADVVVRGADLDLPFSDPALRFMRNVRAHADLELSQGQLSFKTLTADNDQLSLQGGGTLGIQRTAPAKSTLDIRFAVRKTQADPPFAGAFPMLARLNAGQSVTIEVNGIAASPTVRVQP